MPAGRDLAEPTGLARRGRAVAQPGSTGATSSRPIAETASTLSQAGLTVSHVERHDDVLLETIQQVETRLCALRLADLPPLRGLDLCRGIDLARRAADAVRRGDAGYMVTVTPARPVRTFLFMVLRTR
jgi:hypothetical protein